MPRRKPAPSPLPKPRRPRGAGTVFHDKRRNVFVARLKGCGEFRSPDRAACVEWLRTARPAAPDVTVGDWCDRWLAAHTARAGSLKVFAARIEKRIRPSFGGRPLTSLTAWDVEEAAAKWAGSPATIRGTLATLSSICRAAMRAKLLGENPVALARRPRPGDQTFDLFTRQEVRAIYEAARAGPPTWAFAVLALTGMRIGEALALAPADFDPAALRLSISRTWTARGIQDEPKSRRSRRTIDVHEGLRDILAAGVPRVHYATQADRWGRLLARLSLRARGVHQLRHTFASHALADGVPVPDLAAHLGHDPAELLRTYAHPTGADMRAAAARVAGLSAGAGSGG